MKRSLDIEAFISGVKQRIAGFVFLIIVVICGGLNMGIVGIVNPDTVMMKAGISIVVSVGTLVAIFKSSIEIRRLSEQLTGLKQILRLARRNECYPEQASESDIREVELFIRHYTRSLLGIGGTATANTKQ